MLANLNYEQAEQALIIGDRNAIMSMVKDLSPIYQAQVYLAINLMPQNEFKNLCALILKGLEYLKNNDREGLNDYLTSIKVPAPIIKAILQKLDTDAVSDQ